MPEPTPRDAVRALRRQVRRVRWRRNAYELQRAVYLLVATAGSAATLLVVLAVAARPVWFAAWAWGIGAAWLLAVAAVLTATRRRWLRPARAPLWIDARAGLRGFLATGMELSSIHHAPFLPLLLRENERRLASWAPEALVPNPFPPAALGAATAAGAAFMLAVLLAPRLAPPLPEPARRASFPPVIADGHRRHPGREDRSESGTQSALARGAAVLQQRIRQHLLGAERQAAEEAPLARADSPERAPADGSRAAGGATLERSWEIARRPAERTGRDDAEHGERAVAGDRHGADGARLDAVRAAAAEDGVGAPAAGAGTATDPDIYGPPSAIEGGTRIYELPIAARVRGLGAAPAPPAGDPPPADADARPDLGPRQRRESPVPKMDVPAAWEPIVREMFGHHS